MTNRFFFAFILFIFFIMFWMIFKADYLCDERAHFMTITEISLDKISAETLNRNAQIPTYYYLFAGLKRIFGIEDIMFLRLAQTLLSILTILVVWLTVKEVDPINAQIKTIQVMLLPTLNIFLVLVYNESLTLLFTLLSFYTVLKKRYLLSWLTLLFSIMLRQNNIIWLLFLLAYQWLDIIGYRFDLPKLKQFIKQVWGYLFSILFIAIFFYLNKGPALADQHANPLTIHSENIFFLLLILPTLFLPVIFIKINQIIKIILKKKNLWIILPVLFLVYWYFFKADNFFNSQHYIFHLRNKLIWLILESNWNKTLFFIPIALGFLFLLIEKFINQKYYPLYLFSLFYLSTLWLIEPRYYIIPLTFFVIFRKIDNIKIEWAQTIYMTIFALYLIWGSVKFLFFL